jgi:precorrin-6B methylase 2
MNRRSALALLGAGIARAFAQDRTPDVPYVPTPQEVVDEMLKLADVHDGDTLMDLGCGDGRIVVTAAKRYHVQATGVDIDPERIAEANENATRQRVTDKVRFVQGDLFEADLSKANVVTLYLLPSINLRLRPKLWKELKPGSRVVSHSFDMDDWKPDRTGEVNGRRIYLWIITGKEGKG